MKGRSENRGGGPPPSMDLLVCFPSRAHLTLMPKPVSSPARQPSTLNRHRRSRSRAGQARPTEIAEPTSPKVTCAGQIKVITPKPKPKPCKNWQSVMEEIERLHNRRQRKKSLLCFKKDAYQFLTCLRRLRFEFRCFGAFGSSDPTTTTDDEEVDEDDNDYHRKTQMGTDHHHHHIHDEKESSRTVFSKWFMVLQEEQNCNANKSVIEIKKEDPCAPPANALLLMRCRSAPAKNLLLRGEGEKKEKSNSLEVLMKFDTEFYKLSSKQQLLRSRTCKR